MDKVTTRQQREARENYVLEQLGSELTQPWVLLVGVLVLALLGLLTWRWIRRLPRDARSTPLWRYGLYGLVLAVGLAFALGLTNNLFKSDKARRKEAAQRATGSAPKVEKSATFLPPPPVRFSEPLFRRLILVPWVYVECETPPKPSLDCLPWLFLPDGTYLRSANQQVVDSAHRDSRPNLWDMRATDEISGVIAVDKGTLLPFELVGDNELRLGNRRYRRGDYPELRLPPAPQRLGSRSKMSILGGLERLVATPWRKAHPFNSGTQPELITFHPNGQFEASYRQGSCVHRAPFHVDEKQLSLTWKEDTCREGPPAPPSFTSPEYPAWFLGDMLLLNDVYLPASAPPTPPRIFAGDPQWGLMVTGQFSQELRQAVPTELVLTLHLPNGVGDRPLGELWIWMRERWPEQGPVKPRREQVFFTTPLSGPASGAREYRAQVTPEFGGPVELEVELSLNGHGDQVPPRRLFRVYTGEVGK
jgi:hypothetical protein